MSRALQLFVFSFFFFTGSLAFTDEPPPGALTPPVLQEKIDAIYPEMAAMQKVGGEVVATLYIDATGAVVKVEVTSEQPSEMGFAEAASAAMEAFLFAPATKEGEAIPAKISMTYVFAPTQEEEESPEEVLSEEMPLAPEEEAPLPEEITAPPEAPPLSLIGEVLQRGTRQPLSGMLISIEGEDENLVEVFTDARGRFEARLEPGKWMVSIEEERFGTHRSEEVVEAGSVTEVTYYIEPEYYDSYVEEEGEYIYETRDKKMRKEVSMRRMEVAEIQRVPGTRGDAFKVVQNLPGVARSTMDMGQLVVRGSAPEDSMYRMDGAEIPLLYHFGGLTAVVNSDVLASIDFYPGNFSTRYGRAMGGVVDVVTRAPKKDKLTGYVDIDIADTSAFVEGPITEDLSFQLSVRRSYLDAIMGFFLGDMDEFEMTVAPRYWDYQARLNWTPIAKHEFELFLYGSDDLLEFLVEQPNQERDPFGFGTGFHRGQLSWDYRDEEISNSLLYNFGMTTTSVVLGSLGIDETTYTHTLRDEVKVQATRNLEVRAGVDIELDDFEVDSDIPGGFGPGQGGGDRENQDFDDEDEVQTQGTAFRPAAFLEGDLNATEDLLLRMGGRVDYDSNIESWAGDLRGAIYYDFNDFVSVNAGVGSFSQPPELRDTFSGSGNPELDWQHAMHYALGTALTLPLYEPLSLEVTGFYKTLDDLVEESEGTIIKDGEVVDLNLVNSGEGRVYGAELLLRHAIAHNFFGWIAYTYSRAERLDEEGDWQLFDYDQTHILTMIASYRFSGGWQVGARYRYVSGNPYTPRVGSVFDSTSGSYLPVEGAVNSDRMPAFSQLDIRVDKTWLFDLWSLSAYLDIQNVLYDPNVEAVQYNYDSTEQSYVEGLPILPTLGIKGEF